MRAVTYETTTDAQLNTQFIVSGVFGVGYTVYALTANPNGPVRALFAGVTSGQVIYIVHDCAALAAQPITLLPAYPSGAFSLAYGVMYQFLAYNCVAGTPYAACKLLALGVPAAVP